jgi:hypothetical protein
MKEWARGGGMEFDPGRERWYFNILGVAFANCETLM